MKFYVTSQSSSGPFVIPSEGPWLNFFEKIFELGHRVVPLEENPDVFIFMNNHPQLSKRITREKMKAIKILILWEPKVTRPSNFERCTHDFDFIFSPSPLWINSEKVIYFPWPQTPKVISNSNWVDWEKREDKVLLFQSNKFSFTKGELYSLRREVVQKCRESIILYGKGWRDRPQTVVELGKSLIRQLRWGDLHDFTLPKNIFVKPKNYQGYSKDKMELLSHAKYSVVIENSTDYLSEKLFEAAVTGNVSIYVGPSLESFGIPRIAIEVEPNAESICEAIRRVRENEFDVSQIRENLERFLISEQYLQMQNDRVLAQLAEAIVNRVIG